jgi:hypothetical protein
MRGDMKPGIPVATAVLIAGLMTTSALIPPPAAAKVQERPGVSADRPITATDDVVLSSAAVKALRHIAQARGDIENGDGGGAQLQLDQANILLDIAEAALPATTVKDRIWVAKKHLEYESTQQVLTELVPIYRSLDELTAYMPVQDARRHLDQAKASLAKNDKDKAIAEFDAADAALLYVEADIPLRTTRQLMRRAREDIQNGDAQAAESALKAAEDNVVFLSVAMHEPLAEAHRSLWRASQDYVAGAYGAAKTDVHRAVRYLDYASNDADKETRAGIKTLLAKAHSLEQKIGAKSREVPALLSDLWNRTEALSERSVEYFTTGWQRMRANDDLKAKLIEAKLHLSYAEADSLLGNDAKQATGELAQTENYLSKAAAEAPKGQTAGIQAVRSGVKGLSSDQAETRLKDRYAEVKSRLGRLIETL